MKTKILVNLFAIVSMLVIVGMSWMPTASAWETEGTETIDEDYYWYTPIEFFSGDYFTLSFTIDVQNDMYIDVILLNEENFNKYKNHDSFSYYKGTDFNTIYTKASITFYTHDNYYLVVDNTDYPSNGAMPPWDGVNSYCTFYYIVSGEAHYYPSDGGGSSTTYDDEESFDMLCVVGLLALMLLAVVILAVVVGLVLKRKRQMPPVAPPYQQPQQPLQSYYRDQQPPPPPDYRPPQQPY